MYKEFQPGNVVRFIEHSEEQVKWANLDDPLKKGLVLNDYYTVDAVQVHSWHTRLTLKEKPGAFNSVHFQFINES